MLSRLCFSAIQSTTAYKIDSENTKTIRSYSRYEKLNYYKLHLIKLKFYHIFKLISVNIWLKMLKIAKMAPWFLADVHTDG